MLFFYLINYYSAEAGIHPKKLSHSKLNKDSLVSF
jgi:hypothetical protein